MDLKQPTASRMKNTACRHPGELNDFLCTGSPSDTTVEHLGPARIL